MKHEVVVLGSDGEQLHADEVTPEQMFMMLASAAIRVERLETAIAQVAMLLLHHLGEAPPPSACSIEDVIFDLQLSLNEIHDVIELNDRMRQRMDFLNSRE